MTCPVDAPSDEKLCGDGLSRQSQLSELLQALNRQAELITRLIEVQFSMTAAIGDLIAEGQEENDDDAPSGMGAGRGGVIAR